MKYQLGEMLKITVKNDHKEYVGIFDGNSAGQIRIITESYRNKKYIKSYDLQNIEITAIDRFWLIQELKNICRQMENIYNRFCRNLIIEEILCSAIDFENIDDIELISIYNIIAYSFMDLADSVKHKLSKCKARLYSVK